MDQKQHLPKILVVDDVPANLIAMKRLMKKQDIEIVTATDGYQALDLVSKHDFAVVLLDVQMPQIDGYEVAVRIRAEQHSKHLPIIFVTANSTEEVSIIKGYVVGAVDYVTKPINKGILISKVCIFVELYHNQRELKNLNEELKIAQQVANRSNVLKSEFLANISHELRTPMHAIMGFTELGAMYIDDWSKEEQIANFKEIQDSSSRLLALVDDLLDLSKLEAHVVKLEFATYDLQEITERAVKSVKTLADDKALNLIISATEITTIVECDAHKILQVLTNFLSNAIKFTPAGKNITLGFAETMLPLGRRKKDTDEISAISVSIIDQGIGIPEDELDTVFDKFIQSSKTKTGAGGTGLGLAICKEIIQEHKGKIWAENSKTDGAKFTFTIPVKQPIREQKNVV